MFLRFERLNIFTLVIIFYLCLLNLTDLGKESTVQLPSQSGSAVTFGAIIKTRLWGSARSIRAHLGWARLNLINLSAFGGKFVRVAVHHECPLYGVRRRPLFGGFN